ncbi:RING-type E3 ubiquitin transferase [Salvia divinorum]|uniref:RING-type E3 ubiquitin transferase n=1 Tax=Salvia divinorum TaxID=28513 RepID=A0ABD1H9F0_SALDI
MFVPSTIQEGFAFANCTECRAKFILRANVPPDHWSLRLKFQFLVAREHARSFLLLFSWSTWWKTEKLTSMCKNLIRAITLS